MNNLELLKEKNCQIYMTYSSDEQIIKYNLKENCNLHLFNIYNDLNLPNINKLNCHYSQLIIAYYIWKNQIKSDYVCIWDHRRSIVPIDFDELDKGKIQAYGDFYTNCTPYEYMIKDGINEYIIWQFIKYMIEVKHIDHDIIIDKMFNKPWENKVWVYSIFNCNWELFNNLCKFMFDFIDYIIPNGKHNNYEDVSKFVCDMQRTFNVVEDNYKDNFLIGNFGRVKSGDRVIGNIYELIFPIYLDFCGNGYFISENNKKIGTELICINKSDNEILNIIDKWIAKNTFTGCKQFYIKTDNINRLNNILDREPNIIPNRWTLCSGTIYVCNEIPNDALIIKTNEYIDNNMQLDELNINNIKSM